MKNIATTRLNAISNLIMLLLLYSAFNQLLILVDDILHMKGDYWITADWLINYSNGFIRRGLLGEILLGLSNISGINLIKLTTYCQLFIISITIGLTIYLYLKTKRTFVEKMLICSPAFYIGFSYWTYRSTFRKESLLFVVFASIILLSHLLKKKRLSSGHYLTITLFLYASFALIHEMIIFYMPFFVFLFFIFYRENLINKKMLLITFISFGLINLLLLIITYIFHGAPNSWEVICNSLGKTPQNFCSGAIYATSFTLAESINDTKAHIILEEYYIYYPINILLAGVPFLFISYSKELFIKIFVITSMIFIIPLFVIAFDWGRWITIYITLFTFITFYLIQTQKAFIKPFCHKHPTLMFIFFFLYIFSWIMPHCCNLSRAPTLFLYIITLLKVNPF